MTSLIFGTIYLGHHAFTEHRREKQRVKNYERWEGLRDEYDAQRQITRQTRSLDIQRTGSGWEDPDQHKPILTLRDQQEANDARTGWRPQEVWDGPTGRPNPTGSIVQSEYPPQTHAEFAQQQQYRHVSMPTSNSPVTEDTQIQQQQQQPPAQQMMPQQTGAWDSALPPPLRVSRRTYDNYEDTFGDRYRGSRPGSVPPRQAQTESRRTSSSLNGDPSYDAFRSSNYVPSGLRDDITDSVTPGSHSNTPVRRSSPPKSNNPFENPSPRSNNPFDTTNLSATAPVVQQRHEEPVDSVWIPSLLPTPGEKQLREVSMPVVDVYPNQNTVHAPAPGGRMAELIERGY